MAVTDGRRDEDDDGPALFEEEGVFSDEEGGDFNLALFSAALSGDINALRLALDNFDGTVDEPIYDGCTLLHLSCLYGHLGCVQFLLERGANIEAKDNDGGIPLHDACAQGHTEIVQLLLSAANNPECVWRMLETIDIERYTPLHRAARSQCAYVVRLLLSHGASPNATNYLGKTPIELAEPGTEARRILEEATDL